MTKASIAISLMMSLAALHAGQARAVDPRCAMFGTDMSDPANIIMRRRCAAVNDRVNHPVHNPFGSGPGQVNLVPGAGVSLTGHGPISQRGGDRCRQGLVWREAFAGDHLCVPPGQRHR